MGSSRAPAGRRAPQNPWTQQRLVLGVQPVREALRVHGQGVQTVLLSDRGNAVLAGIERFAQDRQVAEVRLVPEAELDALSRGSRHQGVAAWVPPLKKHSLSDLLSDPSLLCVALDGVQDPQNFGAAVRSAVALAGAAILWGENHTAPLTPTTFRASAGAIEHARLCQVPSLRGALSDMALQGISVVGLAPDGSIALHALDLTGPTVLVTGSEGDGLSRGIRRTCTSIARLGGSEHVDSMNASAATAVALYEAWRQRAAP